MNKVETTKLLSMLRAVWSNEEVTPEKIEVYQWLLGDFPFDQVLAACKTHMTTATFFPKPAELLALIAGAVTPQTTPGEAWSLVKRQMLRYGLARSSEWTFPDPAIADAVKAAGVNHLCQSDEQYARRDFEKAFAEAQDRHRRVLQDGTAAIGAGHRTALTDRLAD